MSDGDRLVEQALIILWARLGLEEHLEAALSLALLARSLATETKDERLKQLADTWLTIGAQDWLKRSSGQRVDNALRPQCSFCGREEPDVKLATGASGFICNSCVATLHKAFASDTLPP